MGNLNNLIETKLDKIVRNKLFPYFVQFAKEFIKEDYYDIYEPKIYKRQYRLLNKWKMNKNEGKYEFYINESVKGEWNGKLDYLPALILKGNVYRIENGKKTLIPRPFISNLRSAISKDKKFKEMLKLNLNIEVK